LRKRFKVAGKEDVAKIRGLGIAALYIDTKRGLDPDPPTAPDRALEPRSETARPAQRQEGAEEPRASLAEERVKAERIQREACQLVTGMMDDVRLGRQPDIERVNPVVENIVGSIFRNQDALLGLSRIRRMDRYTFEHSVGVSVLMVSFARTLGLERDIIHQIGFGALLHDIGKVLVPSEILNKPGRLSEDEFVVMRMHVAHSQAILADSPGISPVALAVAAEHHERVDGSGYPARKRESDISQYGRMAAIADVYDAITSDRVYHKGIEPHAALGKLLEWSEQHFESTLVQQFIQCVGIYPVGSLVRLESGRIGVVIESARAGLLRPVVRVLVDAKTRRFLRPLDIDLSEQKGDVQDRIVGAERPEAWRINPEAYLGQVA
jgi:HD-GYP domain-containing protein (c-di-GMP phosphodiesterase class II)